MGQQEETWFWNWVPTIPRFQHSIIPWAPCRLGVKENHIFSGGCRISETFNYVPALSYSSSRRCGQEPFRSNVPIFVRMAEKEQIIDAYEVHNLREVSYFRNEAVHRGITLDKMNTQSVLKTAKKILNRSQTNSSSQLKFFIYLLFYLICQNYF